MKILYLSLSYVPSRRASAVHVMKMCSALAEQGHQVTLVTKSSKSRQEPGVEDDFAFYAVPPGFSLVKLRRPAFRGGGLVFLYNVWRFLAVQDRRPDLVYARDLPAAVIAARQRLPIIFEAHAPPPGKTGRFLFKRLSSARTFRRLVVISDALRRMFNDAGLVPSRLDVVVAHDAADPLPPVDTSTLDVAPLEEHANGMDIGYVGHLYEGRGVRRVIETARRLQAHRFHLVGGTSEDLKRWQVRELPSNVTFHGFVPHQRLVDYYRSFDVLLAPYQQSVRVASGGDTTTWMSPMKIFEYMATGKPIVASDLPVLREILRQEENCLLVDPENAEAWANALRRLADDPALARTLGARAQEDFRRSHTWEERARRVIDGL